MMTTPCCYHLSLWCSVVVPQLQKLGHVRSGHSTKPWAIMGPYSSHTQLNCDSFNSWLIQPLRYIYELSNGDLTSAADLILTGPSLESLLSCIGSALVDGEFNECLLKIAEDEQEGRIW